MGNIKLKKKMQNKIKSRNFQHTDKISIEYMLIHQINLHKKYQLLILDYTNNSTVTLNFLTCQTWLLQVVYIFF